MLAARVEPTTLELQVLDIEPTLENLRKYATIGGQGFVELHRIGLGLELYCDEDAAIKNEPFTCLVRWKHPISSTPAEVALRGPVLILERHSKGGLKGFLKKITQVVQPVDRPLSTGPEESAPQE